MKRTVLLCAITLGLGLYLAPTVRTDDTKKKAPETRLRFVNIAKVLRDFKSANESGSQFAEQRTEFTKEMEALEAKFRDAQNKLKVATDKDERLRLSKESADMATKISALEAEVKSKVEKISNETLVRVYQQIKTIINEVGKEQQASVLCYPGPSTPEDANHPAIALLMLQIPAVIPYYLEEGIDITDLVIERLNKRFPAKGKMKD